jgi:exopolysaccharide biosynthesis polyprenyl glycosylphosphotransferase
MWLVAGVAFISYATHADLSRVLVAITTPLIIVGTLLGRFSARKMLHRRVQRGRVIYRVVVAGSRQEVRDLVRHMRSAKHVGFSVIGACVPGRLRAIDLPDGSVPVIGQLGVIAEVALDAGADTIAIAGTSMISNLALRRLSWQLEGTGAQLVVAPAIRDIAGPRIQIWPLAGLPLLHVQESQFTGWKRLVKGMLDRSLAVAIILLLSPVLLGIALAIRVTSDGPVLFRQVRVGRLGTEFVLWKFRTMRVGAELELEGLLDQNKHGDDGPMFKMRWDPRVTPLGRWLRRYSLDELPQLWNVIRGSMSLVGPRPPLPSETAQYARDVHRRLLVKPGITGLWQVSGRADLPWIEAVRLDLYYVENWSVVMDLALLWRTVATVVRRNGAY